MPSLFETLLRFRCHPVAMTADIEKAFLQIEINPADRDSLRFLWYDDVHKDNPSVVEFRWCRLAFGLKPSPSILGATIRKHISLFQEEHPETVEALSRLYADDLSCGADTVEEAFKLYIESKGILAKGGFNLRKWQTNDLELRNKINAIEKVHVPPNNSLSNASEANDSPLQSSGGRSTSQPLTKVLGVSWNHDTDQLCYNLHPVVELSHSLTPTKRSLLKIAAKIFDPMGCLSLFTINLKALFQELCLSKLPWDEELSGEPLEQYQKLMAKLHSLKGIGINRSFVLKGEKLVKLELHAFSDASERAYASVVYLRTISETGDVTIHFIASKAKVSPIKQQSIPRLELLGAHLMAKLVSTIQSILSEEFPNIPIENFYWVDSIAVLCWIRNEKVWKQFVRHRVSDILQSSTREQWYYCPGVLNPADLPSRGQCGTALADNPLWWEGPQFLTRPCSEWPSNIANNELEITEAMEEKIKVEPSITHAMVSSNSKEESQLSNIFDISRFSTRGKLLRTLSWVYRFIQNLKLAVNKKPLNREGTISVTEFEYAETNLIKSIQGVAFNKEIEYLQSSKSAKAPLYVSQFNLTIDEKHVLRCRSRINNAAVIESCKQPILLPPGNHYVTLLIQECHEKIFHNGTRETLNAIRQRFWIPRGREAVKKLIRRCFICRKLEGLPFKTVFCPNLPLCRVDDSPPFTHTGLDFAGPLMLKNGTNIKKHYVCLFTCMATRAIHLELTESLEVNSFLQAFRRFAARRGLPSKLLSDNAKTFKSAAKEIKQLLRTPRLAEALSLQGIKWQFITERSPWEGGAWERLIRSVKRCVIKVVGKAMLTLNEMSTLLVEVEGVINTRPLTYVHDDNEGISYPLTPSHLINGRNLSSLPNNTYFEIVSTYESLSKRARYHRFLLGQFTKRWKNEYLLGLMEAYKPKDSTKEPIISIGDVVLLKNDQSKRAFWKLCRVVELPRGLDGRIRSAKVRMASQEGKFGNQVLCRPLKLLIPLEISCNLNAPTDAMSQSSQAAAQQLPTPTKPQQTQMPQLQHAQPQRTTTPAQQSSRPRRNAAIVGELLRRGKNYSVR